jgi:hypothetical protein
MPAALSVAATKSRLLRARKILRKALKETIPLKSTLRHSQLRGKGAAKPSLITRLFLGF